MTTNTEWQTFAACNGKAHLFFEETRKKTVKKAKAICATCSVKPICLAVALESDELGIWGGMTTNERRKFLRERRRAERQKKS